MIDTGDEKTDRLVKRMSDQLTSAAATLFEIGERTFEITGDPQKSLASIHGTSLHMLSFFTNLVTDKSNDLVKAAMKDKDKENLK